MTDFIIEKTRPQTSDQSGSSLLRGVKPVSSTFKENTRPLQLPPLTKVNDITIFGGKEEETC